MNGQSAESKLSQSFPQDVYRQTTLLSSSLDTKTLNTYSDDPLSLLADVASMAPSTNGPGLLSEVQIAIANLLQFCAIELLQQSAL